MEQTLINLYETDPAHAAQVKKLALLLFDKTKGIVHNLSERDRELLEAGALWHDLGHYISEKGHNKHSYKLIMQEKPAGFSYEELQIIGNIARYHRKKLPSNKHTNYACLSREGKQLVNKLSAFVRIADGLDRSHRSIVDDIDVTYGGVLVVNLWLSTPDYSMELLKANEKKDLFEQEFGISVQFKLTSNRDS